MLFLDAMVATTNLIMFMEVCPTRLPRTANSSNMEPAALEHLEFEAISGLLED